MEIVVSGLVLVTGLLLAGYVQARRRNRALSAEMEDVTARRGVVESRLGSEVRGLINAVTGYCEILDAEVEAPQRRHIAGIRDSTDVLLGLVANSTFFFNSPAVCKSRFSLRGMIEEISAPVRPQIAGKNVHFEVHWEPGSPDVVDSDAAMVAQILRNVVGHSIALTTRGHVEITVHDVSSRSALSISIDDTGPSFCNDSRGQQFNAFGLDGVIAGGTPAGIGLNLCVARKLARALGGDIGCIARPSEGSVYTISLPVEVHTRADDPTPAPTDEKIVRLKDLYSLHRAKLTPRNVLVIEDQVSVQRIIMGVLEKGGHNVRTAESGDIAIELLSEHEFDVVFVDLRLPGTSGIDVMKLGRFASARGNPPFIVMTGETSEQIKQECYNAGAWAFLTKPVSSQRVLDTLVTVCDRAEQVANRHSTTVMGPLNGRLGSAVSATASILDSMRYALCYLSEAEAAADARDWTCARRAVRALRGVAAELSAPRLLNACTQIINASANDVQRQWRAYHQEVSGSLDEARKEIGKRLDAPMDVE